ncbi:uncharacterized protein LOC129972277 isoform X2 [Argiope bruennichi]|uniref:uncharacterized protein LOC129972277 isoform X2 n=1 Tax=Argiope bruennichi TaxID=94029 RepID=UPI0024944B01|nr:uncharacterized protein LOC129972277 isoform X2 [Argiope bruennichi]
MYNPCLFFLLICLVMSQEHTPPPPPSQNASFQRESKTPPSQTASFQREPKKDESSLPVVGAEVAERAREFLTWTFKDVFDWNPRYFQQIRGILNIIEVILSMFVMSLIASACQMQPYVETRVTGFYCKSSDTFLFAVSTSAFLHSTLLMVCCLLSKKTESRLWSTSYEVTFYVFYSVLYFMSSVSLTSNVINRNKGKYEQEESYNNTLAGGVFGIFAFLVYGLSAAWFFIHHKNVAKQESSEPGSSV